MEGLIRQNIEEHALLSPGERVLVAVSGGADSIALLHVLRHLGTQMDFSVVGAHFNHGIRPAAARDAAHVARLCHCLGIACVFGAGDVPGYAHKEKVGLEEAGRVLRYRFLREAARRCGCGRIATAHHQQDQAETVIMRLARGTSVSGLTGILVQNLPFIRPMLAVERRQIEDYLQQRGLAWVEDESNRNCRFTRNHVRHNLMPLLETVHPQAQKQIAQLAQQVCLEEDYWDGEVRKSMKKAHFGAAETRISYAELSALHPALRLRVVRALLEHVRGNLYGLERKHLHAVESMFASSKPQTQFDLPGAWVARRYADVVFRQSAPQEIALDYLLRIDGLGRYPIPDGSSVELAFSPKARGETLYCVELDGAEVKWPLYVRENRPGDRLKCVGMSGSKKLKAVFAEARLEAEARKSVPLLCNHEDEIIWVMGIRRSRLWCCDPSTHKVVRVVFTPTRPKL